MLKTIEIKNGVMTPKYDLYNDYYTVTIEEHINKLDIYYELEKNVSVNILGNENITDEISQVTINLNSGDKTRVIYLNVNKNVVKNASELQNYFTSLEVKKREEISSFVAPLIGSICFLVIIITYSILFHKKKKKIKII